MYSRIQNVVGNMKAARIIKGWAKRFGIVKVTTAEAKLSALRLSICEICPIAEESKLLQIVNGSANYVDTLICGKCKCPCLEKSLVVEEKCPIKKW